MGADVLEADSNGEESTAGGCGTVVSVGEDFFHAGELYAHLTRRRHLPVNDPSEIFVTDLEVVVAPSSAFTYAWLDKLYSRENAVGLILADSPSAAFRQVLARSAALLLSDAAELRQLDVAGSVAVGVLERGDRTFIGSEASTASVRQALATGGSLVTIHGHSDGIDAGVGRATLCGVIDSDAPHGERPPLCVSRARCHRFGHAPIERIGDNPEIISPNAIRAPVLVLRTCWGSLPEPWPVDPSWSLIRRLVASDSVGAILSTWQFLFAGSAAIAGLQHDLMSGVELGIALGRHNQRSRSDENSGSAMCLFGDPRMRLRSTSTWLQPEVPGDRVAAEASPVRPDFLRVCIALALRRQTEAIQEKGQRALEQLEAYEFQVRAGIEAEGHVLAPGPVLRRRLLEFFAARGGGLPVLEWNRFTTDKERLADGVCFGCSLTTRRFRVRLRLRGSPIRLLETCPRCGIVEDRAEALPRLWFSVRGGQVYAHAERDTRGVDAIVCVHSHAPGYKLGWFWPKDECDRLVSYEAFPLNVPAGVVHLALCYMEGTDFGMARVLVPQGNV